MSLGSPTWSGRSVKAPVPLRSWGMIGENGVLLCSVSAQLMSQPSTRCCNTGRVDENGSSNRPLDTKRWRASKDERLYSAARSREFCGTDGFAALESRLDAVSSAFDSV